MSIKEKLLDRLFHRQDTFTWDDAVTLFKSLGCQKKEGRGSRVKIIFTGESRRLTLSIHRPHTNSNMGLGRMSAICDYIIEVLEEQEETT
jgi:hypothetical protein